MLSVIRGGLPRLSHACRGAAGNHTPSLDARRAHADVCARPMTRIMTAAELSNDPIARRRELLVVLELCAARERGAREGLGSCMTRW